MDTDESKLRRDVLRPALLSLAVAFLAAAWVWSDGSEVGVTWDEPTYFASSVRIQDWTGALISGPDRATTLDPATISEAWDWAHYWNPHPPVYKEAMALTERVTAGALGSVRGFRLAPLILFSILVGVIAWVGAREWGLVAGAAAGVSVMLMPRVFGHAHIGATDIPLTCFWLLGTLAAVRFIERGTVGPGVLAAVGFGLALGTKFTGLLLLLPVFAWMLLYERRARSLLRLAGIGVSALLVFYLVNPLSWHDPVGYVHTLVVDSLSRETVVPVTSYYLGRSYAFAGPWHQAIVMTLVTVPLGLLALALWGVGSALPTLKREPLVGLCIVEILFFWALLGAPSSPNHDGVRLFLPMFPFVALLTGRGVAEVGKLVRRRLGRAELALASAFGAIVFFLPAYLQTVAISPYYLSYYNELVGGVRGGAERGMEVTYWYDAITPAFLERLNETLPPDAVLATFPSQDYFLALQGLGTLREDIVISDTLPSPYYLIYGRRGMFTPIEWNIFRNVQPLLAVELQGVELAGLYQYQPPDD